MQVRRLQLNGVVALLDETLQNSDSNKFGTGFGLRVPVELLQLIADLSCSRLEWYVYTYVYANKKSGNDIF